MTFLSNDCLILPISHARAANAQSPDAVLATLCDKLPVLVKEPNNDVDVIYTTGLYQNNATEDVGKQRDNLLQRESEHRIRFNKLVRQRAAAGPVAGHDLKPHAIDMVTWDQILVRDWNEFQLYKDRLSALYKTDPAFQQAVAADITHMNRVPTKENLRFLFEEIAVMPLWLQGKMVAPCRLRSQAGSGKTVVVYPGPVLQSLPVGLEKILRDKKGFQPLLWLNTADATVTATTYRFGKQNGTIVPLAFS